jgi:mono/diheme cytochrome c family protein
MVLLAVGGPRADGGPVEAEPEDLRPGLVAHYRSLVDKEARLDRLDAKPAFRWGDSSPHPCIPPGEFEVVWAGVLRLTDAGPITFDADVCGEVRMEVDGVVVLQGSGRREDARVGPGKPLERPRGVYKLRIRYRSFAGAPARLQVGWQGPTFAREPLPAWQLGHLPAELPPEVSGEQRADAGRVAVARFGCAGCHGNAFPGVAEPPPGPSLADLRGRVRRDWLLDWLDEPARMRPDAHMPALFAGGRRGFVERWVVADSLLGQDSTVRRPDAQKPGDHRRGRVAFISIGCIACHFLPDLERSTQPAFDRTPLSGLADRLPPVALAAFLENPHPRYPDGRMPRLPVPANLGRDIAAYLLLWSKPTATRSNEAQPPSAKEIEELSRRLGTQGLAATAAALLREKRCAACHPGLEPAVSADVPLRGNDDARGCLSGRSLPRFRMDTARRQAIAAYRVVAARDKHPSPFAARPPPLEAIASTLGGSLLESVPYQRTPRLSYPHQKYTRSHLLAAVRDGLSGLRGPRYTYPMPAFGSDAEAVVRGLAEGDGDLPDGPEPAERPPADPTLGPLAGPRLAGFQGYACVSCHVWNGRPLADPDPGAVGTDLTRVAGRIRRAWFDRYLEGPARSHPGTPMPAIFTHGERASLAAVLDGDAAKQKEALWSYFALGKQAPSPKPPPPLPIPAPASGEPPLVAQVPLRLPEGTTVEALCILYPSHDLVVYDVGANALHGCYTGARILRGVQGRLRTFSTVGTQVDGFRTDPPPRLVGPGKPEVPLQRTFEGYDRLPDGVRLRWRARYAAGTVQIAETLRLGKDRVLTRAFRLAGVPAGRSVEVSDRTYPLGEAKSPPAAEPVTLADPGKVEGSLERPGYRAIAYPRPKTSSGEDRVMPGALAIDPKDGRVFVASMKTGEILVLRDPTADGKQARFDDYTRGLFQEALSMLAEPGALYVLHRRNLTRVVDADGDGVADRFDRVAALPHGVADTYDYGYGLVRDRGGAFVFSLAPYANPHLPGSGGAVRLTPGGELREIATGFRNPLGWCAGRDGDIFCTDNQGEWVATNKLCHVVEGRFYGFPNPGRGSRGGRPFGRTAVWVPYGWARSINGVAYDHTGGKFGPFAGQFFLAELMFGGGIVRASLEKVNGEYQGACFPFWGRGLLGPLTVAFDPRGRLWVGGITEPGWMAQPDRGALFRIDFTGPEPFEMQTIRVLPRGFRIVFTRPVSALTARDPASYKVEHYRYEYTGAYGSPELDRTAAAVERVELAADGRSVDLITAPLVKDRVYWIEARGVRSAGGEPLVHPAGAYTLNEIPPGKP